MDATVLKKTLVLRTGPARGFNVNARAVRDATGNVLAANEAGDMLFVKFDSAEGWAAADSVQVTGDIATLSVWKEPMKNHKFRIIKPPKDNRAIGTITSASDFKNGPSYAYETMLSIAEGAEVTLQAQSNDTFWVYVSAEKLGGWLPRSKINTDSDLTKLRVMNDTSEGALYFPRGTVIPAKLARRMHPRGKAASVGTLQQDEEVKIIARSKNATWLFVIAEAGDGWVPAKRLNLLGEAEPKKVSVWLRAASSG